MTVAPLDTTTVIAQSALPVSTIPGDATSSPLVLTSSTNATALTAPPMTILSFAPNTAARFPAYPQPQQQQPDHAINISKSSHATSSIDRSGICSGHPQCAIDPRRCILCVDDQEINTKLLVRMANTLGFAADYALDGAQAIQKVLNRPPNSPYAMILMDINMPDMSGIEAARALRAAGVRTPIVALTGISRQQERIEAQQAGMNDFMAKPIRRNDLLKLMHAYDPTAAPGGSPLLLSDSSAAVATAGQHSQHSQHPPAPNTLQTTTTARSTDHTPAMELLPVPAPPQPPLRLLPPPPVGPDYSKVDPSLPTTLTTISNVTRSTPASGAGAGGGGGTGGTGGAGNSGAGTSDGNKSGDDNSTTPRGFSGNNIGATGRRSPGTATLADTLTTDHSQLSSSSSSSSTPHAMLGAGASASGATTVDVGRNEETRALLIAPSVHAHIDVVSNKQCSQKKE
jgi:CheY-like chemotaxis protein